MNEYDKLLWTALRLELGQSKALDFIADMNAIGLDLKVNTKWCVENRQVIYKAIVAWQFGLLDSIKIIQKELK